MLETLALAEGGRGWVEPNPMVGALVIRDGQVIASGYHTGFGNAHAEVAALEDCRRRGINPAGATMVVNLEPCSHQGKTPPCTEALIKAQIGELIVAMEDPFVSVAGRGLSRLREAGVNVLVGVAEAEARRLNAPYLKRLATRLPWVIVKWAQTVDGKIATATSRSKWISGEASRRRVHELRGRVDAVMIGVGTVIADDPQLTARGVEVRRVARRVVIDPNRRMPSRAKLAIQTQPPVMVGSDPQQLLRQLADEGATNVLVEGGAKLFGSLFEAELVDQVLVFIAPRVAGDRSALDAVCGLRMPMVADAQRLDLVAAERIGDDVMLDYLVRKEPPERSARLPMDRDQQP